MGQDELDRDIHRWYVEHDEGDRLLTLNAAGAVELGRVRGLLAERLAPGSRVLDVGGATGVHAEWLAARGHDVTLIDLVPEQVDVAARIGTFAALVGDARHLEFADDSFDAVLLFGPLYHLITRADRLTALREAVRVLRVGGWLSASAITRLPAAIGAVLRRDFRDLPAQDVMRYLESGEQNDPAGEFPFGHLHTAAELADELRAVGLTQVDVCGIEGPASFGLELVEPSPEITAAAVLLAEQAQGHPFSANLSSHLFAAARKQS